MKMGLKCSHTYDVIFDICRFPESGVLSGPFMENKGFKAAMKTLNRGRLHISAICVGTAERLIADSLAYAMERKQFDERLPASN